jgi:transposase
MSELSNKSKWDLHQQISKLTTENARLTTLNQDMDGQIRDLLTRRAMTDEQWAEHERIVTEHRILVQGQAEAIQYLRSKYPGDFSRVGGPHQGKGFWEIVMEYLKAKES